MTPYADGIQIISPHGGFLADRGANYTSQFGEDGLIQACLEKFWACNQWCFEVGAADGLFFSNTARFREKGWNVVLIEGDAAQYEKLRTLASEKIHTVPEKIGPRSLDRILRKCKAPQDIDLGIIDIDGQDYWAWDGMREFKPRLMLVEFAYTTNDFPDEFPECDGPGQATFKAIKRLGEEKGYEALASTHCNLLFCRSDLL